jgi:Ni/Co efflux regulator RcnB
MGILALILALASAGGAIWKDQQDQSNTQKSKDYQQGMDSTDTDNALQQQKDQRKQAIARALKKAVPFGPNQPKVGPGKPNYDTNSTPDQITGSARALGSVNWGSLLNSGSSPSSDIESGVGAAINS